MTAQPDEDATARAWRAEVRLTYELRYIRAIGWQPSFRSALLASSGHFAIIMAGARWGLRS